MSQIRESAITSQAPIKVILLLWLVPTSNLDVLEKLSVFNAQTHKSWFDDDGTLKLTISDVVTVF